MPADLRLLTGDPSDADASEGLDASLRAMAGMQIGEEMSRSLREHGIRTVQESMRQEKRRRTLRRFSIGAVAVAAGMMLWFGAHKQNASVETSSGFAQVTSTNGEVEVAMLESGVRSKERAWASIVSSRKFERGFALRTAASSVAEISFDEAVRVLVRERTELLWQQTAGRRVELIRGRAAFTVRPVAEGEEGFVVVTPYSTVAVLGTAFSVTVLEEDAAACVQVTDGTVEVTSPTGTALVQAGEDFGCSGQKRRSEHQKALEKVADDSPEKPPAKKAEPIEQQAMTVAPRAPDLTQQNELFRKALLAERAGDVAEALRLLDRFLLEYPSSPLAPQVRAQRATLAVRSD